NSIPEGVKDGNFKNIVRWGCSQNRWSTTLSRSLLCEHDSGRNVTCVELEKPCSGLRQLRPHWLSWRLCAMHTAFTISAECLGKHRSSHIRQSREDAKLYRLRGKDIVQRAI
ncbi:unnamed protein product, partial [Ixodes pacificus]